MPVVVARDPKLEKLKRELRRERVKPPAPRRRRRPKRAAPSFGSILLGVAKVAAVIILPFLLCVRGSVYLYMHGTPTVGAILASAVVALCLIAAYAGTLSRRFTGRARFATMAKWIAAPLVLGWCVYALFYLASTNAKTDEVRRSYTAVHPILRIALSTLILADGELVVTDMKRAPEDYTRMGLPIFDRTLHYRQSDDWVHAVDLRTRGHSDTRNRLVQGYFELMGFSTLRHVGTADHLHVQLPVIRN